MFLHFGEFGIQIVYFLLEKHSTESECFSWTATLMYRGLFIRDVQRGADDWDLTSNSDSTQRLPLLKACQCCPAVYC